MNEILDLYENFTVYPGRIHGDDSAFFDYTAPSSIHSDITSWGYGEALGRRCINAAAMARVQATAHIPGVGGRYWLKLVCCLEDWAVYFNDLRIEINGQTVYENSREFVENVNLGWPGLYYSIPADVLTEGDNEILICTRNSSGAGLLLSEVSILRLPEPKAYGQISWQAAARRGERYAVAVAAPKDSFRELSGCVNCRLEQVAYFDADTCILSLVSDEEGMASAEAVFDGGRTLLQLPQIWENEDFCLVGFDSDDHRHDCAEEAERIARTFALTGMGNYYLFRPQYGRNYLDLMPRSRAEKLTRILTCGPTRFGITDYTLDMPYLREMLADRYFATNIHEPYLWFNYNLEDVEGFKEIYLHDAKAMRACESFGQSEALYRDVLRRRRENLDLGSTFSVGAPSLLSVYEIDAGFDMVAVEPVSNVHLLAGSIRRSPVWGAHVPTDWYFGAPNDACKSRKFRLAMQYFYLEGASYIYAENALFKTNAFSREDWESRFCAMNRAYLRDFYAYTVSHPRRGKQIVDKAIIYGNHENFFWQLHDRMAELDADGDWDSLLWGKWEDHHRRCWKACEAWLPIAQDQSEPYRTPVNKNLFSGSPYGNVDIVSCGSDWSEYGSLALLGWNTMTPELLEKLEAYVRGGGKLLISYCHFNMTDRNDREMSFPEAARLRSLLGMEISGEFVPEGSVILSDGRRAEIDSPLTCVSAELTAARVLLSDSCGNGLVYTNRFGEGTVYFCAFKEYFTADWAIEAVQDVMRAMGEAGQVRCSDPNIFFTRRELPDGRQQVDMLNMCCAREGNTIQATLRIGSREYPCSVTEGTVTTLTVDAQ